MSIDPRLAERRKSVAEDNAKRNIGRLLRFLGTLAVVGGLVWLALSPFLSVSQVRTAGVASSDTHSTLVSEGVVAGIQPRGHVTLIGGVRPSSWLRCPRTSVRP